MLEIVEGTLFLLLLLYGCVAPAFPLAEAMLGKEGPVLGVMAVAILSSLYLTLLFHSLLFFSAFDRITAAAVLAAGVGVVRLSGFTHRALSESVKRDLGAIKRCIRAGRWKPARLVYLLAALFAAVTVARALMLPTVGWDTITYHFVKAGMWVQSGGPITLRAPGGWSTYYSSFGGGEIFTAWAMLPFGNDLLACGVDLVWWGLLALAFYALGREFGLRVRHRWVAVTYGLFVPAVWDAVGWGYVDLANSALSLMGLAFGIRYLRLRSPPLILLSMLALGLAAGVKLTSVPFLGMTGAILLLSLRRSAEERGRRAGYLLLGGLGSGLVVGPWLLSNFLDTGYPLPIPLTVGGIRLGADNPAFTWYQDRDIAPYTFAAEWNALRGLFQLPDVNASHLSALSLPPLALTPFAFIRLFRGRPELRPALGLSFCLLFANLLSFYSPSFSFPRLEFTWVNGRFLVSAVFVCIALAFAALPAAGRWRDLLGGYLLVAALVHFYEFGPVRLTTPSTSLVAIGTSAVAVGLLLPLLLERAPAIAARVALPILMLGLVVGLYQLRSVDQRYALLANRNVLADVFRYWWEAAKSVDEESVSHRIAVTAGARQDADNWLMYYFMGKDLQNTLHYVPISTGGEIIPFGPDARRRDEGDVDAWMSRLREMRISHVMSFFPTSVEIGWMSARPASFERITGNGNHWALFRVLRETPRQRGRGPTGRS